MASSSNNAGFPPNPLLYHLNAETRYYLCRRCRTPVLDPDNIFRLIQGKVEGILCDSPFNVKTHDTIHRFFNELPINNVCCNYCSKHIGEKFIVAGDTDPPRPYPLEGRVLLYWNRLLFWNGTQLIDADSDELVKRLVFFDGTQFHSE